MAAVAQTTRPTTAPSTSRTRPPSTQPSADQVLEDMLKPAPDQGKPLPMPPTGVALDKTSGVGAVMPSAPAAPVRREGTFIVDRIGHLSRTADGTQAEFAFDSDGKALKDAPLIILPNLKLVQMEDAVTGNNRDVKFRITGVVTEYRGRNYILLEKVIVVSEISQQF
jgi:hypothetical protein